MWELLWRCCWLEGFYPATPTAACPRRRMIVINSDLGGPYTTAVVFGKLHTGTCTAWVPLLIIRDTHCWRAIVETSIKFRSEACGELSAESAWPNLAADFQHLFIFRKKLKWKRKLSFIEKYTISNTHFWSQNKTIPVVYFWKINACSMYLLVHGQVTIIFVVSVCLSVCLFVQSFSQPSLIRFRSS